MYIVKEKISLKNFGDLRTGKKCAEYAANCCMRILQKKL